MKIHKNHIFTLAESAMAYAVCAERIFSGNDGFLEANQQAIPIFVSHLFQSLEISIKHAGIESTLFTMEEARAPEKRSGHDIRQLATLAVEKIGGKPFQPIVMAMTFFNANRKSEEIIRQMICGEKLEKTRECYASRCLGYAEVAAGDFAIINPVSDWIEAVKQTASNLQYTVNILRQWRASPSKSKNFAIWLEDQRSNSRDIDR